MAGGSNVDGWMDDGWAEIKKGDEKGMDDRPHQ